MSKHTQGPWEVVKGIYGDLTVDNGPKGHLSEFPIATIQGPLNDKQANAALIAAAPTMASRIQGAIDALSQNAVFPADIALAKALLIDALETAGIKPLNMENR